MTLLGDMNVLRHMALLGDTTVLRHMALLGHMNLLGHMTLLGQMALLSHMAEAGGVPSFFRSRGGCSLWLPRLGWCGDCGCGC
jgi:hypothetical protein